MSSINVLFTNMLTQLRKRKLEISFTTQFPQMISYGVLTQVDLFVLCEKVAGGRAIKLYIFDHWGQWTGKTWKKNFPQPKWEADWVKTILNQVKEMVQKDESGELEQYAEITKIYDLKPYFEKEGYGFVRQGGKTWGVKND